MAKRKSHKQRAKEMLEALGWTVADVEKWLPRTNIRVDLFGFADLLCVNAGQTLAVQVCALRSSGGGDIAIHQTKMLAEPRLCECLDAGWLVELWGIRREPNSRGELVSIRSFELLGDDSIVVCEGSEVLIPVE
jgi:hypothetical protein